MSATIDEFEVVNALSQALNLKVRVSLIVHCPSLLKPVVFAVCFQCVSILSPIYTPLISGLNRAQFQPSSFWYVMSRDCSNEQNLKYFGYRSTTQLLISQMR